MAVKVSDVLSGKGFEVVTVTPEQSIDSAAKLLTEKRIGAAPVLDPQKQLIGILSERDIIRGLAREGDAVLAFPVERLMTREVKTCGLDETIVELMEVMTDRRIRHLPVIQDGVLRGIISIGDVVKQRLSEAQFELEQLRKYISS
jgi:CBS domain-containing protein